LINAAGTHIEQPAEELAIEAWDTVLDVNLRGAFLLSQAAARSAIAHGIGGSHVHVTSVRSELGIRRGYAAYCASKGGLGILIKQLAAEWARYGIRVNGVGPTFTRTPLVAGYLNDPDFYRALVERIPLGRVCETADLAGIAVFLASGASAFITGQNILVDGGVTATQ
jgi:NAD(P)-dependent dehydrogenase (short-subunit alcohol dehydrogenase family)